MKFFNSTLAALLILGAALIPASTVIVGCRTASQQRTTFNTVYSVGASVDAAYKGYLDAVIAGQLSTNSVNGISRRYDAFQAAFRAAVVLVTLKTNAVADPALISQSVGLLTQIDLAKKGDKIK